MTISGYDYIVHVSSRKVAEDHVQIIKTLIIFRGRMENYTF